MKYNPAIGARVVSAAARFVGLSEIKANAQWDNLDTAVKDAIAEEFRAELLRVGWQMGWPYCAAFCEVAWKRAYQGLAEFPLVSQMLTPGCMVSFQNAAEVGWTSQSPQIGAIGIMQRGDSPQGHAFIVRGWDDKQVHTIEANTSPGVSEIAKDREGDGVYLKQRNLVFKPAMGLHLVGFIIPCTELS